MLQVNFITAPNYKFLCLELQFEPPFCVWSRSRPNWVGAGAAQKSGGSETL